MIVMLTLEPPCLNSVLKTLEVEEDSTFLYMHLDDQW